MSENKKIVPLCLNIFQPWALIYQPPKGVYLLSICIRIRIHTVYTHMYYKHLCRSRTHYFDNHCQEKKSLQELLMTFVTSWKLGCRKCKFHHYKEKYNSMILWSQEAIKISNQAIFQRLHMKKYGRARLTIPNHAFINSQERWPHR